MDGYKLRQHPLPKVLKWIWDAALTGWDHDTDKVSTYQDFEDFLLINVGLRSDSARRQYMKLLRAHGYISFKDHDGKNRPGQPRQVKIHLEPKLPSELSGKGVNLPGSPATGSL